MTYRQLSNQESKPQRKLTNRLRRQRQAVKRAVKQSGGDAIVAKALGVSRAAVWNWQHRNVEMPAQYVVPLSTLTAERVTAQQLREDVFSRNNVTAAYYQIIGGRR